MALVKYNNRSILNVTALDSVASGDMNLLATNTISSGVSSSSFTSNIDSTYDTYLFKFLNMHPSASSYFSFNMSADGGSNYNVTKTSTFFYGLHFENAGTAQVDYDTGRDLAQGTGVQHLSAYQSADNSDDCISGSLFLFNPSNTTFVKHYIAQASGVITNPGNTNNFTGGYANTTSAINAVQFSFSSGNIDSGVIKMYGLSKS